MKKSAISFAFVIIVITLTVTAMLSACTDEKAPETSSQISSGEQYAQLRQDWLDDELIGTDFWYDNVKYSDDIPDNDLTKIIEKLKKTEFVGFEEGKIHPQNGYKLSLDYPDQTIEYSIPNAEHIQITITDKNAELVGTTNKDESIVQGENLNTYYRISDNAYNELEKLFTAIVNSKEVEIGQIPQDWLSKQPESIYIYNATGSQFNLKADITTFIGKLSALTYTDIGKQPDELPDGGGKGFVLGYQDKTVDYWFNAGNTLWLTEGDNEAVIYTIPKDVYDDIFNYDWIGIE